MAGTGRTRSADIWTIPAERAKNGREHELPLSRPARALLASVPRGGGPFVFSTTDGARPVSGFSRAKTITDRYVAEALAEAGAAKMQAWRWHDLRRTCRTEMARLGVPTEIAEHVLNHSGDPLVRTYNRYRYQSEMAEALERWGGPSFCASSESARRPTTSPGWRSHRDGVFGGRGVRHLYYYAKVARRR